MRMMNDGYGVMYDVWHDIIHRQCGESIMGMGMGSMIGDESNVEVMRERSTGGDE